MVRVIITSSADAGWDMITDLDFRDDNYTDEEKAKIKEKYAEIDSMILDRFQVADAKNFIGEKLGLPATEVDVHIHDANSCLYDDCLLD